MIVQKSTVYVTFTKSHPMHLPNAILHTAVMIILSQKITGIELNTYFLQLHVQKYTLSDTAENFFVLATHSLSSSDLETTYKIKGEDDGSLCLWMSDSFPASPAALRVQSSATAGMSDAEMGLTEPGAGGDAHCVLEVLRRLSSRFGSG